MPRRHRPIKRSLWEWNKLVVASYDYIVPNYDYFDSICSNHLVFATDEQVSLEENHNDQVYILLATQLVDIVVQIATSCQKQL